MNMQEAVTALEQIAAATGEKYHFIEYKISSRGESMDAAQECTVYLNGYGSHSATRWEHALQSLQAEVNGEANITF